MIRQPWGDRERDDHLADLEFVRQGLANIGYDCSLQALRTAGQVLAQKNWRSGQILLALGIGHCNPRPDWRVAKRTLANGFVNPAASA